MADTTVSTLTRVRENLLAKLEEVSVNPKPNYSIDGQSVSHGDYFKNLLSSITQVNQQIAAAESFEYIEEIY